MTLTVPFAGNDAGRAARAQPVAVPQFGAAIAAIGEQLNATGSKIEADRLDREMRRLQVDMTRDLGQLRLQAEEIGDPDQLDAFWADGIGAMRERYLTGTRDDGRPVVDPKLRDDWEIGFDDLANKHAFEIGQVGLALRQSAEVATHADFRREVIGQATTAGPDVRDQLYANFDADVDRLQAKGLYTPETARDAKLAFRVETETNDAIKLLDSDPEGLLDNIAAGMLSSLPPNDVALWETKARDKLAAGVAIAEKTWAKTTEAALKDGIAIAGKGLRATQEALLADPAVQEAFPDLVAEFQGAVQLRADGKVLPLLPLPDLYALRDELSAETYSETYQTEKLAAVEAQIAAAEAGLQADPIGYSREAGNPISTLDFTDASAFGRTLARREGEAAWLVERGDIREPVYLDAAEREELNARLAVANDPSERLGFAVQIARTFAGDNPGAIGDLIEDPVLAGVAEMRTLGVGTDRLAREILEGQRVQAAKDVPEPSTAQWRQVFFGDFDGMFADGVGEGLPDETAARDQIMGMAWSLYLARARGDEEFADGKIKPEALRQAFHEVAGGTGSFDSGKARGGIQNFRGRFTPMPPGLRAGDIDDALRGVAITIDSGFMTPDKWREISATGTSPKIGRGPIDAATLNRVGILPVNGGAYALTWEDPGPPPRTATVYGDDGQPFMIDLYKLLRRGAGE